jgi:hypothetical protein
MMDSRADDFGPDADGRIVALAEFLRQGQAPAPPPQRRRPLVTVTRSEARAAAGTGNDLVNGRIVREAAEAIAGPDALDSSTSSQEAVAEAVALLREIGPRDAREALIARRLVALDAMAMETLALARASTAYPMLRDAYAAQAVALSRAATSLDEALERRRVGKPEQRVVVQYIRGGQVVGMVSKEGGSG